MKKFLLLLALICSGIAQTPKPTKLTDKEKVEIWTELGTLNDLMRERQVLEQKIQTAGSVFEGHLNERRKAHGAIGCEIDYGNMHWKNCKAPDKANTNK